MKNINKSIQEAKNLLEEKGFNVLAIFLYGSQNYEMETENSDIDLKAVVCPTLEDIVRQTKAVSTVIDYSQGQIDLKDIRLFFQNIGKCNPVYAELLNSKFTEFFDNEFEKTFKEVREDFFEEIINSPRFFRGCTAQIEQKRVAFSHPYPSIKDKIDKYGYDPKQLHHIVRFYFLMKEQNFIPKEKDFVLSLKTNPLPLAEAEKIRDKFIEKVHIEFPFSGNKEVETTLENKLRKIGEDFLIYKFNS